MRGSIRPRRRSNPNAVRFFAAAALGASCGLAGIAAGASPEEKTRIIGVVCTPGKTYRDAAAAIDQVLKARGYRTLSTELSAEAEKAASERAASPTQPAASAPTALAEAADPAKAAEEAIRRMAASRPAAILTCGAPATSLVLAYSADVPVVFCMVPNALDAPFLLDEGPRRRPLAGITTDVAPSEQIDWIVRMCPAVRTIGVLRSPRTRRTAEAIRAAAAMKGVRILVIDARFDDFPRAIEALNAQSVSGVLMLPDAAVYNSVNVQRLLLWGIRQKKPVWAFSANIVKAGALAGQFSDNEALAAQAADLVEKVIRREIGDAISLQYPKLVRTAINERTTEMIGVTISPGVLASASLRFGKGP